MKKLLVGLAAFCLSAPAYAGFGFTSSMGSLPDGTYWVPSVDVRTKGWTIQIHALDLLNVIDDKGINLGVGVTKNVMTAKCSEDVEAVLAPGGAVRLNTNTDFEPVDFNLVAEVRAGAELKKKGGVGIYVVPMLGVSSMSAMTTIASGDSDIDLLAGGGVEISVWFK